MDMWHRRLVRLVLVLAVGFGLGACVFGFERSETISYYREIRPEMLGIVTSNGAGDWTHVTRVVETSSTVTVDVSSWNLPHLPSGSAAEWLELTVSLASPLGDRSVIDGSSGLTLGPVPSPWPPQLGP